MVTLHFNHAILDRSTRTAGRAQLLAEQGPGKRIARPPAAGTHPPAMGGIDKAAFSTRFHNWLPQRPSGWESGGVWQGRISSRFGPKSGLILSFRRRPGGFDARQHAQWRTHIPADD